MHKHRRVGYFVKVDLPSLTIMFNISEYTWGAFGHVIHLSEVANCRLLLTKEKSFDKDQNDHYYHVQ